MQNLSLLLVVAGIVLCVFGVLMLGVFVREVFLRMRIMKAVSILRIDFLEFLKKQNDGKELRKFLRDEYRVQNELLRWRVRRFLSQYAEGLDGDTKKRVLRKEKMLADGFGVHLTVTVQKRMRFTSHYPFVAVVVTESCLILGWALSKEPLLTVHGPSLELVGDIQDMCWAWSMLSRFITGLPQP